MKACSVDSLDLELSRGGCTNEVADDSLSPSSSTASSSHNSLNGSNDITMVSDNERMYQTESDRSASYYDKYSYPKTCDEFECRLEQSSDLLPAYLPMIVTNDYSHEGNDKQQHSTSVLSPNSSSLANAKIDVKRGMLVSALYKKTNMILVITPQNTSGFIPAIHVHPLGIKVDTTDFTQQFPEFTSFSNSSVTDEDIDLLLNNSMASMSSYGSYNLNNLDSLNLRKQSRLILTRMAIMRAQNQYSSPELSFCVNYNQGNKRPNISLLNQRETFSNTSSCSNIPESPNKNTTLRRTNSKSQTTQTYCKTYNKPLVSILKSPVKDTKKKELSRTKTCTIVDGNNNDMTVTVSPWWTRTPSIVTMSNECTPLTKSTCESSMRIPKSSKIDLCGSKTCDTLKENHQDPCQHNCLFGCSLCGNYSKPFGSQSLPTTDIEHSVYSCTRDHKCCSVCHVTPNEQIYENISAIIATRCKQCNHHNFSTCTNENEEHHNSVSINNNLNQTNVFVPTLNSSRVTFPISSVCSRTSDTDSAISSLSGNKSIGKQTFPRRPGNEKHQPLKMTVLFDYEVIDDVTGDSHFCVHQNDVITVLCDKQNDWLWVRCKDGKVGYIPKAYLVNLQGLHLSSDPFGKSTYL